MSAQTLPTIHNTIPPNRSSKRFSFMNFSAPLDTKLSATVESEISILKNENALLQQRIPSLRKSSSFNILNIKSSKPTQSTTDLSQSISPSDNSIKLTQSHPVSQSPTSTPSLSSASSESLPSSQSSTSSDLDSRDTIPAESLKSAKKASKFKQVFAKLFKSKQPPTPSLEKRLNRTYQSSSLSRSKADLARLYMEDDGELDRTDMDFSLALTEEVETAFTGYSYSAAPMRETYHSSLKKLSDSPNRNLRQIILIQSILKRLKNHPLNGTAFNVACLPEDLVPISRDPDSPILPKQIRVMMAPQRRASLGSATVTSLKSRSRGTIARSYSISSTTKKSNPGVKLSTRDSLNSWDYPTPVLL